MNSKTPLMITAAVAAAVSLSGCVSMSRSSAEAPVSVDVAREGRVESVNLIRTVKAEKVGEDFKVIFESEVKAELDKCATGSRALRLDADVTAYASTNPVVTTLIAGRNRIRGTATLVDVATGRTVGRYNIGKTIVGGRIGILKMGPARKQLSQAFGEEVCMQAFPKGATSTAG